MRNCYIPYCDLLYRTNVSGNNNKRMLFLPPKNETLFEKWKDILPKLKKPFKRHDRICERHFHPDDISTKWDHIINGKLHQLERGKPRLKPNAIPTCNLLTELTEDLLAHELNKNKYKANINHKTDILKIEFDILEREQQEQQQQQQQSPHKFEDIPTKRQKVTVKENDELDYDYELSTINMIDILSDHIEDYKETDENNINKISVIDNENECNEIEYDENECNDDNNNNNNNNNEEVLKSIAIMKNSNDNEGGEEVEFENSLNSYIYKEYSEEDIDNDVVAAADENINIADVNNPADVNNDNDADDDDDDDDNTQFSLIYDNIYEVVLPNSLWGIHRDPNRKFITFSYFDSGQMRTTKIVYINNQLSAKIYLCNHQLVDETLMTINTEYISNLLSDIDEYRICLDIDKNLDVCMAIANGDVDRCSSCLLVVQTL